jgi:hypothetical protein
MTYREYPYPVLSYYSDDYKDEKFISDVKQYFDGVNLLIDIEFNLTSKTLQNLISQDKASYVVHIECGKTRFRKKYTSSDNKMSISIPLDRINDRLELVSMVATRCQIEDFNSEEFNQYFSGINFSLEKGDILALDRDRVINIEKSVDSAEQSTSIFAITVLDNDNESVDWQDENEKILIKLSRSNYERYKSINNSQNLRSTLASLFVVPVLVEIISEIKKDEDAFEHCKWAHIIKKKLENTSLQSSSAISIAYKILPNLIEKSLMDIEDLLMQGEE